MTVIELQLIEVDADEMDIDLSTLAFSFISVFVCT